MRVTRSESPCRSDPCRFQPSSSTKTRSPPADVTASEPFVQPVKTSPVFLRRSSSAISGFRSICGRKRRSSHQPSRSIRPAFRNLSPGAAGRENPGDFARFISGPAPVLWPERSRSQRIFQEVFAFRVGFIAAFFAPRSPGECPPGRFWGLWAGLTPLLSSRLQFGRFGLARLPRPVPRRP